MKATISDLEAEAKFFESTAAEASEGLIEIREEYDEDTEINSSTLGNHLELSFH
jgi:unconventional prefoldin RPB5 interactor 1